MGDCSLPQGSLFLGFDSSTQSLKATVLDSNLNIVTTEIVKFDLELPHYKTENGVYRDPLVNGRIVSPTLMWVEAFDLILERLKKKLDFEKITAVSGSGQQHGSVYWKRGSLVILASLDSKKPLVDQFRDAFSVKESPIWMDCSTTKQCKAIEEAVGGAMELSKLTGSRAHERYAGPQIRKIYETQPEVYQDTERISLISSFMASLLIGAYACIDQTDGAGMNLMDIKQRTWSKAALEATAPSLEEKLGKLAPAHAVAGFIAPYFVERFHFNKDCLVVQWSGDNPNSLAGLTLNTPGDLAISLGTSDTVFGITTEHQPKLEGHFFPNPVDTEGYMVMLVYKNGSLAREDIRNRYADKSWETFNSFLQQTPPLNGGKLGFYYKDNEILPPLPVGFHRYILSKLDGDTSNGLEQEVKEFDPSSEVRALIEGQLLSMRAHAERSGMPTNFSDDLKVYPPFPAMNSDLNSGENIDYDVQILTSGGLRIPAHSSVLASASPVLESIIGSPRKHRSSENTIRILGVPNGAVSVFIGFLYASSCSEEEMEKFGIHLLALSHVYLVPQLKQRCTKALAQRLTIENVVDVLQLARLCDAPDLYLKSMKLIYEKFKAVEHTEGWQFLQSNDPFLELEILHFIDEAELRKKMTKKHKEEQSLYLQLSEAMECLEHICTEGCTSVGPHDIEPSKNKGPCSKFSTCEGLQHSIKHFATCKRKVNGGCLRCKRFWQLLKLHSSICEQSDTCKVPLCRQFKMKTQSDKKGEDVTRWKLLAKKVMSAKVISSLSVSKRKREEEPRGMNIHNDDHFATRSFII